MSITISTIYTNNFVCVQVRACVCVCVCSSIIFMVIKSNAISVYRACNWCRANGAIISNRV